MRTMMLLTLVLIGIAWTGLSAQAADSPWASISELSKKDTPQGNPELTAYLKTLTREQMLQAAREACRQTQDSVPKSEWAGAVVVVAMPLMFYGNEQGGIDDAPLNAALGCIVSSHEGELFRRSLVEFAEKFWCPRLTAGQREECKKCFLKVMSDSEAPSHLRGVACRALSSILRAEYNGILFADENVRESKMDSVQRRTLIETGTLRIQPVTLQALVPVRGEIEKFTRTLSDLSTSDKEPEDLRNRAKSELGIFAKLPVPPGMSQAEPTTGTATGAPQKR